ncbi:MAG: hypothetical protein ABJC12_10645, partial [Saprospiraceae bacterium]
RTFQTNIGHRIRGLDKIICANSFLKSICGISGKKDLLHPGQISGNRILEFDDCNDSPYL